MKYKPMVKPMIAVANTGDSTISLIDPFLLREVYRMRLPINSGPYDLKYIGYEHLILVTLNYSDSLACLDISNGRILEVMAVGRRPSHIAYDKISGLAYITNSDTDTVSMVSIDPLGNMKLMKQMMVGSMPMGIDYNSIFQELCIANFNTKEITLIDTRDFTLKASIKLDVNPFQVKYSPGGNVLYIGCMSSHDNALGYLLAFDTDRQKILFRILLEDVPGEVYIDETDKYALTSSMGKGGIEFIDLEGRESFLRIPTNGMTQGMAVDAEVRNIYVTNPDDNSVSVIDWPLRKKVATIGVGKEPNGIVMIG